MLAHNRGTIIIMIIIKSHRIMRALERERVRRISVIQTQVREFNTHSHTHTYTHARAYREREERSPQPH